jgi:hypothetical protein
VAHANHSKELINAIRAKRNFPNLSSLPMSKQQEILDHSLGHFDDLKLSLKAIEQIVKDEAIKDIRSTVWVLHTGVYVVMAIVVTMFLLDFSGALGQPLWAVYNDLSDKAYQALLKYLPFL